ncbi:MAG: hypothetical protein NC131_01270 [Roseburia sp.]|nr:hypothetical protein [Roseburia sp.]
MEYKVYFNLNFMGIVKCDKDFCPYVPENENLKPLVEFHYGILKYDKQIYLLHFLERIAERLNNGTITIKPYLTKQNVKWWNLP